MSADKIIEKIQAKAQEDVAAIEAEAKEKCEKIVAAIDAQTEADLEAMKISEAAETKEIHRRRQLMTRLEERKRALAAKRQVMAEAFEEAEKRLEMLEDDHWIQMIKKIVVSSAETGREQLVVPQADRARYTGPFADGKSMLEILNEALTAAGKPGQLTLSDAPARFSAGIMLVGEESDVDASFEGLIRDAREKYEYEVSKILFDEVEV
ncbi:MAG: V-type ATP synthase subunit E family protein [Eubacterium sp.]|nr:V-type ATP synthase subunit E family protein [Eubacterium sp.]